MTYRAGESAYVDFTTNNADGERTDADSAPTVTLYRNGEPDGDVDVTVESDSEGAYLATCTIPEDYEPGDDIRFKIEAEVGEVPGVLFKGQGTVEGLAVVLPDPAPDGYGGELAYYVIGPLDLTALDSGIDGKLTVFEGQEVTLAMQFTDGKGRAVPFNPALELDGMLTDAAGTAQTGDSAPVVTALSAALGQVTVTFTGPSTSGLYQLTTGVSNAIFGPYAVQVRKR